MKIQKLFKQDPQTLRAIPELNPGLQWVMAGEGLVTIKLDGQRVSIKDKNMYPDVDYGVPPITRENPDYKWAWEAYDNAKLKSLGVPDGIYIAYGPNIKGNPQGSPRHFMVRIIPIDANLMLTTPTIKRGSKYTVKDLYDSIQHEFSGGDVEGLVFHLEQPTFNFVEGATVTRRDFGMAWPIAPPTVSQQWEPLSTAVEYIPFLD